MAERNYYKIIFTAGFITGIFFRILLIFHNNTDDFKAIYEWGNDTLLKGLSQSFHGIYFPLQYQIFSLCSFIVNSLQIDYIFVFKAANLLFDVLNFIVIFYLLKYFKINVLYALLYWFHPWFLSIFSLGYIDSQFCFFLLLSILLLKQKDTFKNYAIAGIPFGIAFLMKPQMLILMIALIFFSICYIIKYKNLKISGMFLFSILLFTGYSFYFGISHFQAKGIAAYLYLAKYYLNLTSYMPCLTAQMLNVWYPAAYLMKDVNDVSYHVRDDIVILNLFKIKDLAATIVMVLLFFYTLLVFKNSQLHIMKKILIIFGFAVFITPFLMTSAHENHLYLASVLLIPVSAMLKDKILNIAFQITLLIQFINIYILYGQGKWVLGIKKLYFEKGMFVLSFLSILFLIIIFISFLKFTKKYTE